MLRQPAFIPAPLCYTSFRSSIGSPLHPFRSHTAAYKPYSRLQRVSPSYSQSHRCLLDACSLIPPPVAEPVEATATKQATVHPRHGLQPASAFHSLISCKDPPTFQFLVNTSRHTSWYKLVLTATSQVPCILSYNSISRSLSPSG